MNRYLAGLVVLVAAGVCYVALFDNSEKDDIAAKTEDKVYSSSTTDVHSGRAAVAEEQPEVEEIVEAEVEAPSNIEAEEVAAEAVIDAPMEVETEPEDFVSLDSFDRPYNRTVTEEDFNKLSPEDQRRVVNAVAADARGLKMGVMGCYQETRELIKAGDYAAAEEKVSEILDASIAFDGGEGTLTLSRVIGLNSQNDLLGIMSQIHGAAGNRDAQAQVGERMRDIQGSMKTLKERQDTSYNMYWH